MLKPCNCHAFPKHMVSKRAKTIDLQSKPTISGSGLGRVHWEAGGTRVGDNIIIVGFTMYINQTPVIDCLWDPQIENI